MGGRDGLALHLPADQTWVDMTSASPQLGRTLGAATLAGIHGMPLEMSALVADLHARALDLFGPVDGELMGIAYLESEAGGPMRPLE